MENKYLFEELKTIVKSLGKMFYPYCEVVLHDLSDPEHAIIAIENSMSGRKVGDPTTNIGLKRINDPKFPKVLQNYQSMTPDGRVMKSTSIGVNDESGKCIGAICFNFDVSSFTQVNKQLQEFLKTDNTNVPTKKFFKSTSITELDKFIKTYCTNNKLNISNLSFEDKKQIVQELQEQGYLSIKGAPKTVANILGISRATVYNYLK
jgi:predicted transcriptional regulator YheO